MWDSNCNTQPQKKWPYECWSQKYFGDEGHTAQIVRPKTKKNFDPTNVGFKNIFGPKNISNPEMFRSKIFGPKKNFPTKRFVG